MFMPHGGSDMKNLEPFDLKNIESALRQFLFETSNVEEGVTLLLRNPQLLTDFIENLFESLIKDARFENNEELAQFYKSRQILLQVVRNSLSKKDIVFLHVVRQLLLKKEILTQHPDLIKLDKPFEFQEILDKVQTWLKAPTREKSIHLLQQYPELLTDQPERMFCFLIDEAHRHGNEFFVRVLRTISEFFRIMRLALGEKDVASVSKDELREVVKQALDQTDFSVFIEGKQRVTFLA